MSGEIVQSPIAQIGFAKSPDDEPTFYAADSLPSPGEIKQQLGSGEFYMRAIGFESADAITAVLTEAGFDQLRHVGRLPEVVTGGTTIRVKHEIVADRPILRALTKIAVNYLVATHPALARLASFRAVKDYVRYDRDPGFRVIRPNTNSVLANQPEGKRLLAHTLTLRHQPDGAVMASVSLFNQMRYDVTLAPMGFLVALPPEFMTTGHLFDIANRAVFDLTHGSQLADHLTVRL